MAQENKGRVREKDGALKEKRKAKGRELYILGRVVLFSLVLLGAMELALSADQNWHPKIMKQELFLTAIIDCA